jgi:hypothetical protein
MRCGLTRRAPALFPQDESGLVLGKAIASCGSRVGKI